MEDSLISFEKFEEIVKPELIELEDGEALWARASTLFGNCSPNLSFDITNVMLHAVEQGAKKVDEVLSLLETHWEKHLKFQHPDICGMVKDRFLGVNPTKKLFLDICDHTLGLEPQAA